MNPKPKSLFKRLIPLSLLCLLAVFNACKKHDINEPLAVNDPVINEAKQWFEAAYPKNAINKPLQVNSDGVAVNPDLSQKIRPDWGQNRNYQRFGQDVIEMPVHASASLKSAFVNGSTKKAYGSYDYSRSSYLLLKKDGKYQAYIMTVIGDSSYLKNDLNKLARNTYNKRDTNFSGTVVYTTPKGKYINSWKYKNGNLVTPTAPSNNATQQKGKIATQNYAPIECVDVFYYEIVDGVLTVWNYAFTVCKLGNGQSDDGPGSAPAPPQCPQAAGKISINGNAPPSDDEPIGQPGNDPGFPPPNPPQTGSQCVIQQPPPEQNPELEVKLDSLQNEENLFDCDSLQLLQLAAYNNYGSMYQKVANFHPGSTVMSRINSLQASSANFAAIDDFVLQNLDQAYGSIVNSDFFPVKITTLPTGMNMAGLTEYFRLHMSDFTAGNATFTPYTDYFTNDTQRFNQPGAQSVGSLVHIDMLNDGTVIESDYQSNANGTYFTFSTMTSPLDNNHPVSGNREFGVYPDSNNPGSYVFYTMGVDRISDWKFAFGGNILDGFGEADKLWTAMQNKMINYINTHGGNAQLYLKKNYVARPDFDIVKEYLEGKITLAQLKAKIGC